MSATNPVERILVLDDDPTGTQSASGVRVLLDLDQAALANAMLENRALYVLTNTRALQEADAVALLKNLRSSAEQIAAESGYTLRFVLRGDSTLRGHVFAETEVFSDADTRIIFQPAFPQGGRTTIGGYHFLATSGTPVPVHLTEYAHDPVFPFETSDLGQYTSERSHRQPWPISLAEVRSGRHSLATLMLTSPAGSVLLPDAETDEDLQLIADAIHHLWELGHKLAVRSASPLAAMLAGAASNGLLKTNPVPTTGATLVVCGSHTLGATSQLEALVGFHRIEISTSAAMDDPTAEGLRAAAEARESLAHHAIAIVASERTRLAEHNKLSDGQSVADALIQTTQALADTVDLVISKGGITSAETARAGLGAAEAEVVGQLFPGVSLWRLELEGRTVWLVVVPGNVGPASALRDAITFLRPVAIKEFV